MIFNFKNCRLLFIHIPKCAGTTIEEQLNVQSMDPIPLDNSLPREDLLWGQKNGLQLQHCTASELFKLGHCADDFDYIFTVIRDPLDRIISEIRWQMEHPYFQYDASIRRVVEGYLSPDEFKFCHYKHQFEFIRGIEGNINIFRIDQIQILESELRDRFGICLDLASRKNTTNSFLSIETMSTEVRSRLLDACALDYTEMSEYFDPPEGLV